MPEKELPTININYDEFRNVAIEAINEMVKATQDPMLGMIAVALCIDIADKMFSKENLTIDEDEE